MKKFDDAQALACRQQFPGLARQHQGRPVIFFDGPAGTQVPLRVAQAMSDYLLYHNANRGGKFATSRETDELLVAAGQAFADFVGTDDRREISFGQNMTSLTLAFSRALAQTWNAGEEIVVSATDHDANITPWALAARERGVTVRQIPVQADDGLLNLEAYAELLSTRTRLVAVGCACNASGGLNPVREMIEMAHAVGAEVFLDGVHYAPHGLIDVHDWGCDYLGFSAYKFFGPHLGVMWGRRERLAQLQPYKLRPSSDELPWRWMTGTQSFEAIAGGQAAIDYLADLGRDLAGSQELSRRHALQTAFREIQAYETDLAWELIAGLQQIPGVKVIGITDPNRRHERIATVCFVHQTLATALLVERLADRGICAWGGNYYAADFTRQLGLEPGGMVRLGLLHYNTRGEVNQLLQDLQEICQAASS